MTLLRKLADHVLEQHPRRAVTVLESLDESETINILKTASIDRAATILACLSPSYAAAALGTLPIDRGATLLGTLSVDTLARLLRRVEAARQGELLGGLPSRLSQSVRSVLSFPETSAGALMDPEVVALPITLTAREAIQRIRRSPEHVHYNVYVLDQEKLVGVLNLRELLAARGTVSLLGIMTRDPYRIIATADRASVVAHPGWRLVHALPVVDRSDAYLGAIRYRTLRALEDELAAGRGEDSDTGAAFGQVIAAGARGLLDALAGAPAAGTGARGQ